MYEVGERSVECRIFICNSAFLHKSPFHGNHVLKPGMSNFDKLSFFPLLPTDPKIVSNTLIIAHKTPLTCINALENKNTFFRNYHPLH